MLSPSGGQAFQLLLLHAIIVVTSVSTHLLHSASCEEVGDDRRH